jgi:hypothetical protein
MLAKALSARHDLSRGKRFLSEERPAWGGISNRNSKRGIIADSWQLRVAL